ncbi:hypothetical protein NW757_003016 [Fusarium falciforme]|nr:hypothetical protein NW757_003016 [Fusarium falciforme]
MGRVENLENVRSAASISMSPEMFEKLYLSPPNAVKGDLRKTFGNPTPMFASPLPPLKKIVI